MGLSYGREQRRSVGSAHSESVVRKWEACSVVQNSILWENSALKLDSAMVYISCISQSRPGIIKHQPG